MKGISYALGAISVILLLVTAFFWLKMSETNADLKELKSEFEWIEMEEKKTIKILEEQVDSQRKEILNLEERLSKCN